MHGARVVLLLPLLACASSLSQVPADKPHGDVQLNFEFESRDFLYEWRAAIDGKPSVEVKSGERVRLSPGRHSLELIAVAHVYGLGEQFVSRPGGCIDPKCVYISNQSEQRIGLVEIDQVECRQQLELSIRASDALVAFLDVARDNRCAAHLTP